MKLYLNKRVPHVADHFDVFRSHYPNVLGARRAPPLLPHIHAHYQDHKVVFEIPSGKVLDGNLPRRQRNYVRAWTSLHADELKANWELAMNNEQLFRIDPLK